MAPWDYTLRELTTMCEAKMHVDYAQISALMATMYNAQPKMTKGPIVELDAFNPFAKRKVAAEMPMGDITDLKIFVR